MMIIKVTLIFLLFAAITGQQIKCGSGFTPYQTKGEDQYIVCENVKDELIFKPSLPRGLQLIDGVIKGSPKKSFNTLPLRLQITKSGDSLEGDWFLTSHNQISNGGIGFKNHILYSNVPFPPIRSFPDSNVDEFSLSPALSQGLEFDDSLGVIQGVYTGIAQKVDYEMNAIYKSQSASSTFSLTFKDASEMTKGYSMCYYPYILRNTFYSDIYYKLMSVDKCVTVDLPLNFTEKYHIEHEHHWPGIPDFYDKQFVMRLDAAFQVSEKNIYEFHVRGTGSSRICIDSNTVIELSEHYKEKTGQATLSEGYHLLTIYYVHNDLDAHLAVQYRANNTIEWIPFNGDNLFVAGPAPSSLKYPTIRTHVNAHVNVTYTQLLMGAGTIRFTVTPALPEGLVLNEITGRITGSVGTPMHLVYTVVAEGITGSCETTLHLVVDRAPLQGLHADYYAIDDAVDVCNQNTFYEHELDRIVSKVDSSLTRSFQPRKSAWEGIPATVFRGKAFVEWDGLLQIDEVGEWTFYVAFYDGLRIKLDNNLIVDSFSCSGRFKDITHRMEFDQTGYHPIHIEFFTNDDDYQFEMKMMKPSMNELVDIPLEMMAYYPMQEFTLSTSRIQLIQNRAMSPIYPVFYSIMPTTPSYSIQPELPSGLQLNENGSIEGTPLEEFDWTEYTITAAFDSQSYETTLTLACYAPILPSEILLQNASGLNVTELTLEIYKETEEYTILCKDETMCSITIEPSLPEGFTFDRVTGKLKGRPLQSMASTQFTITGSTDAGSITYQFAFEVPVCEYGHYFFVHAMSGSYDLMVSSGEKVIVKEEGVQSGKYSSVFCIPKGDYTFTIKNSTQVGMTSFSLTREDNIKYFEVPDSFFFFSETLQVEIHNKPSILFSVNTHYLLKQETFKLPFTTEGLHRPLTIQPALPDGFYLNEFEKTFSGTYRKEGVYTFTITCENEAGATETVLELYVGQCPENYQMIFAKRGVATAGDRITIKREVDKVLVIDHDLGFDTAENHLFCLQPLPHIITVFTKTNGNTKYARPLVLRDREGVVLTTYLLDAQGEEEYRLNMVSLFKEGQNRKVWLSSKKVGKKWKEAGFRDSKWTDMNAGTPASFSDSIRTAYMRYTVDYNANDYVGAFVVYVKASGGFVLYVNGEEAVRVNLPAGELDASDMAYQSVEMSDWYRISVNPNLFISGSNMIAVELHCYTGLPPSSQQVIFDMKSYQLTTRLLYLSNEGDGIPSGSTNNPDPSSKPENAFFDINDNTFWGDGNLPAWIRFTYSNQLAYVNKIILRSAAKAGFDPTKFILFGVRNQTVVEDGVYSVIETKTPLRYVNNYFLFDNDTSHDVTLYLDTHTPYEAYEMQILESTNGVDSVHINSIQLYAEKRIWCEGDKKWPTTETDTRVYRECPFLKIGKRSRVCRKVNYQGVWDDEDDGTCFTRWAGKEEAFVDTSYRIKNCTLFFWNTAVEEAFKEVIVREVTVKEEEVLFYAPYVCSSDFAPAAICVDVRLRPHRLTSEYVQMELNVFNSNATDLFYKKVQDTVPLGMEIIPGGKVSIHQRLSNKDIAFVVTIAILALLNVLLLIMYLKNIRRDGTRKTLKKQRAKAGTGMQTPLLKL